MWKPRETKFKKVAIIVFDAAKQVAQELKHGV